MLASSDTVDKSPLSTIAVTVPNNNENKEQTVPVEAIVVGVKACDDIRYKKYFKMMQFGVPATAVKLKMDAEGIDPTLLEYVLLFSNLLPTYIYKLYLQWAEQNIRKWNYCNACRIAELKKLCL